ncbi:MAG: transketolase [Boseongicola sp. SB0664_bin_43]|uniref:Transketolase n=1 Tax=Boseongicola sp. SB0664_bin_43 TaxID=2604844 RepID=A0A6B0XZJ9_9RHOB|nr:transketolase [Boseongicola sp. SB0664_bin_43]MYK32733.1 transketolase [Boseongicola sp. SB0670_bin_30]
MTSNSAKRIKSLELQAARMRRNVVDICMQRGGYAGQGVALSDVGACIYFDEMRPDGNGWYHDRFVNSNGHDTIINFAAMAELGVYTMEELRTMGADGSPIDQSPIEGARGFEITSGSLGTGVSQAAGIALGERKKGSDKRVICLLSDGELHEGSVWEAFMFAAHYKLSNFIVIIDNNDLGATGKTSEVMAVEPIKEKMEAFGLHARQINGNSIPEILDAFEEARNAKGKPFAMIADTRIFAGIGVYQDAIPFAHFVGANGRWDTGYLEWEPGWQEILGTIERLEAELAALDIGQA